MDVALASQLAYGEEVTALEVRAVRTDCIDLVRCIDATDIAVRGVAAGPGPHGDHVPLAPRPLALDPNQLRMEVEDEVVAASLAQGPADSETEVDGGCGQFGLGDIALVGWVEDAGTLVGEVSLEAPGS
jgi:hypothetical protein